MQYISVKGGIIEVNPYTIQLFNRVQCTYLVERLHTSRDVYPRVVFMTVIALHPEAII